MVTFEPLRSLVTVHHIIVLGYLPYLSIYEMKRDYGEHWKTRISVSVSISLPVVSYGAEIWTMTKKEEQVLLIFERKMYRRIYGPKYENGEWKCRPNRELGEMSKGENIVKWIKGQRISWLGHLERMEKDRMPKKIFTQELEGTRPRGRPRKGWKEEAERALQVLGVRRWS